MHQKHLLHVNHAGAEAALAIGQIQLPHPLEAHVKFLGGKTRPGVLEAFAPFGEGAGVVQTKPIGLDQFQSGVGHRLFKPRHRGQHAARENVALDEVGFTAVILECGLLDGDGLVALRAHHP